MTILDKLRLGFCAMTCSLVTATGVLHADNQAVSEAHKQPNFVHTNSAYTYHMSSPYETYNKPLYALLNRQEGSLLGQSIYVGFWGQASFRWTDSNQAGTSRFTTLRGTTKTSGSRFAVGYTSLSFTANAGDWVTAFTDLVYRPNRLNGLNVQQAQIILGNLDKSPIYASIGKGYLPFGNLDNLSQIFESTFTSIFLPRTQNITVGYHEHGFDFTVSGARASTGPVTAGLGFAKNNQTNIDTIIVNGRYSGKCDHCDWFVGAGYCNNGPFNEGLTVQAKNPEWDLNAGVKWDSLTLQAEYIKQVDRFLANGTNVNAIKPYAYHLQGAYDFHFAKYDHKASVGYNTIQLTRQGPAVNKFTGLNLTLVTMVNKNVASFISYDREGMQYTFPPSGATKVRDNRLRLGVRAVF